MYCKSINYSPSPLDSGASRYELEAADRLIRERLVLSEQDWNLFFEALVSPPEPNAALHGAFAAHRHLIAKTPGA